MLIFQKIIDKKSRGVPLNAISIWQEQLSNHPVYQKLTTKEMLKAFMEVHIFAVWDFMSLTKRLQRDLTCVSLPWRPSPYPKEVVRMINEIVLGEESDDDPLLKQLGIGPIDHFSLYLLSMEEMGIDTKPFRKWLEAGNDVALLPTPIKNFVSFNLDLALHAPLHQVAAAFFYGREKLIPDMFTGILKHLEAESDCNIFKAYLQRHIDLDGGEHGLLAEKCLQALIQNKEEEKEATRTALLSLELRSKLWDHVGYDHLYSDVSFPFLRQTRARQYAPI
jgi:hypothetical protein